MQFVERTTRSQAMSALEAQPFIPVFTTSPREGATGVTPFVHYAQRIAADSFAQGLCLSDVTATIDFVPRRAARKMHVTK
jgi:hypothetical protein